MWCEEERGEERRNTREECAHLAFTGGVILNSPSSESPWEPFRPALAGSDGLQGGLELAL